MRLSWILLASALLDAQTFSMRYIAEVGHLRANQAIDLGIGTVKGTQPGFIGLEGHDRSGRPWRVSMEATGGVGWTEVWSSDFDADGQRDLLIGSHFPGNGWCIDRVDLVLLLFDRHGRPNPWVSETYLPRYGRRSFSFPYLPVLLMDVDRDGHAEFVLTDCRREARLGAIESISGVYEAHAGHMRVVLEPNLAAYRRQTGPLPAQPSKWRDPMPRIDEKAAQRVDELAGEEVGCSAFQSTGERPVPKRWVRLEAAPDPCEHAHRTEILLSGNRVQGWPDHVIIDRPEGREVYIRGGAGSWSALRRVMRYGYAVKVIDSGVGGQQWLWADAFEPANPASIVVELIVSESRRTRIVTRPAATCFELEYQPAALKFTRSGARCDLWVQSHDGTRHELLPDKRTVRTSHTAMNHTVTTETRFEARPGAYRNSKHRITHPYAVGREGSRSAVRAAR